MVDHVFFVRKRFKYEVIKAAQRKCNAFLQENDCVLVPAKDQKGVLVLVLGPSLEWVGLTTLCSGKGREVVRGV